MKDGKGEAFSKEQYETIIDFQQEYNVKLVIAKQEWEDRALQSEQQLQAMKDHHDQEMRAMQADHDMEMKAVQDGHNLETQALKDDHKQKVKALQDGHEQETKAMQIRHEQDKIALQGQIDDLKCEIANLQEDNCDDEIIAERVIQAVERHISDEQIIDSFRRLPAEKALSIFEKVNVLLLHLDVWKNMACEILEEIVDRLDKKDKQCNKEIEEMRKALAIPKVEVKGDYVEKKEVKNFNKGSNVFNDQVINPRILPSNENKLLE